MRPLLVDLDPQWRGGQGQALLLLKGLRRRGHDAQFVTVAGSILGKRARDLGLSVHSVSRFLSRAQAALLVRRLLTSSTFDLVHANEPHALSAAWLARAHKKTAVVVSRRVAYPLGQSPFARARYLAAHRILAISDFVKKSVLDSGIAGKSIALVYEGVEMPPATAPEARRKVRQQWGVSEDEVLFGCVGYLLPEKGQELALRALPGVRAKFTNARLLFAGDGRCRQRLEAMSRELGLERTVVFTGFVEDVAQVYAALDAFVFPSLAEPLGTSLLAAMAWGLPVVALATGGVPEYVEDGVTGLLLPRPDPNLLSNAMIRLLNQPEVRKRLGTSAKNAIQTRLTAEHMVENTIRAYEQVLEDRNP